MELQMDAQLEIASLKRQRELRLKNVSERIKKRKSSPDKPKDSTKDLEKPKETPKNSSKTNSTKSSRHKTPETTTRSRSQSPHGWRRSSYSSDYYYYPEYYGNSYSYRTNPSEYWRGSYYDKEGIYMKEGMYMDSHLPHSYSQRSYPYSRDRFYSFREKERDRRGYGVYDSYYGYEAVYPPPPAAYSRDYYFHYPDFYPLAEDTWDRAEGNMNAASSNSYSTAAASSQTHKRKDTVPKPSEKKPPKNDYSQHFVDTRQRPQNFIRDADLQDRFEDCVYRANGVSRYPKLRELITLKDNRIREKATPPMYLKCDLKTFDLSKLGTKFDVILVDPPWQEYSRRAPGADIPFWTFEEIMNLSIESIAENPSFIFLWCGCEEGLDQGRLLLKKWGFRRCEDICWVKTNKTQVEVEAVSMKSDTKFIFHHTKEHCLMGIKGTVRRNQDGHLIHANIDTDIIISEEPALPSTEKPEELYHIIEHFSLGRRRLELFGTDQNIRPGWVTVGIDMSNSNYSADKYKSYFSAEPNGHLLGTTPEIEELRPKSPSVLKKLI